MLVRLEGRGRSIEVDWLWRWRWEGKIWIDINQQTVKSYLVLS